MALSSKSEYIKLSSYEGRKGEVKKVVLLYSGGLDTSTMLKWIQDEYKAEVIALTIDIGQQADDLAEIKQKALDLGASKAIVIDAKDEFAEEYLAKGIKANAQYQGRYYLSTPLGRPLLAKWAVKIAASEGADTIAHGATGKGNDQIRMEGSALALNPDIKIIAPVREWGMGRDEQIEFCKKHGIPVKQTKDKPYSYDDNMWGVTGEGGEIEFPDQIPPLDKILQVCVTPENAADKPEYLKIEFEKGIPVAVNEKQMKLTDTIDYLNKTGAKHAVGIGHVLEDRVIGLKVRKQTLLDERQARVQSLVAAADRILEGVGRRAQTFKTADELNAYLDKSNERVTGTVTMKLFKGQAEAVAVDTPNTVFDEKLATFMKDDHFNQNASAGFIEHYTLQMKLAQRRQRRALIAIGGRDKKIKLLPQVKILSDKGYGLYATYKTHKFLKTNGIEAVLVNKINTPELKPNLMDLLEANRFDLILNIPTDTERESTVEKEKTDGQRIRELAVKTGTPLITEVSVAREVVGKIEKAGV